jgi:hypothetical protein
LTKVFSCSAEYFIKSARTTDQTRAQHFFNCPNALAASRCAGFLDDAQHNIDAASRLGWRSIRFENPPTRGMRWWDWAAWILNEIDRAR